MRNISGFSTAAFVCSTFNPDSLDVTITWMFRAMDDNDSSPLTDDGSDDLVTILDTQSDPSVSDVSTSTSILLLASVTEEREGFYSCQVEYCCGSLESVEAMLTYNGEREGGGSEWGGVDGEWVRRGGLRMYLMCCFFLSCSHTH